MEDQKYLAFLKTAELSSITRAAEALGYTQSAVSRTIAELERKFDLPLLTRNRSGTVLTSEGAQLLPYLQEVCNAYRAVEEQVSELHGLAKGELRVGMTTSISVHWMPELMETFLSQYPNIRFQLHISMEYAEIEEWIEKGRVDCGFVALPVKRELETVFLRRDPWQVLLPPEHPLAHADAYPITAFASDPFIKLAEGRDTEIAEIFRRCGVPQPNAAYTVNDDYAIIAMVERGLGVSLLPELLLRRTPYHIALKPLEPAQFRDIALACRGRHDASPLVRRFITHVTDWAGTFS